MTMLIVRDCFARRLRNDVSCGRLPVEMEKAVLKTLAYADIFDYPLKAWEIHKWLVGKKASLRQVEKALERLNQSSKIKDQKGYFFLAGRMGLVKKRIERERQSRKFLREIKLVSQIFKIIPWIKLIGVSGNLAVENASKKDDIDLFIITSKNRLFISRFLLLFLLSLIGKRRARRQKRGKIAGKYCVNLLVDSDSLAQHNKDIYLAHEVLQMRVLWERDGVYSKYLEENSWVFKYLPNWSTTLLINQKSKKHAPPPEAKNQKYGSSPLRSNNNILRQHALFYRKVSDSAWRSIFDFLEKLSKFFQLRYMGKPSGEEKISEGSLYFHPYDYRKEVLEKFRQKIGNY